MGFRNPITSATDVDTTDGAGGAGVFIAGARATWGDGGGGAGYIQATSSGPTADGSVFDVAGPWFGTVEPKIEFGSVPLGGGGYQSSARVQADRIFQNVATDPIIAPTALTVTASLFAPFLGGYRSPTFAKLASGLVVVYGAMKVNSVTFGAGQLVATLPIGCRPLATERFTLSGWGQTWTADVASNGQIAYVSAGSGASVATGQMLSLAGISFLAEQ